MQTVAQVEFYWPTYNPIEAFDFFEQTPVENVILRQGVQIDYPGNTTGAVYEWMRVNELHVFDTKVIGRHASAAGTAATASRSPAEPSSPCSARETAQTTQPTLSRGRCALNRSSARRARAHQTGTYTQEDVNHEMVGL